MLWIVPKTRLSTTTSHTNEIWGLWFFHSPLVYKDYGGEPMRTHDYMECPDDKGSPLNVLTGDKYQYDCDECEEYYLAEVHPDLCEGSECWCEKIEKIKRN